MSTSCVLLCFVRSLSIMLTESLRCKTDHYKTNPSLTPHRDTGLRNQPVTPVHVPVVSEWTGHPRVQLFFTCSIIVFLAMCAQLAGWLRNSTSKKMKISAQLSILLLLRANHKSKGNWALVFFLSKMAECQWFETHLLGHFPPHSDGFIFKCYVNVITNTEKVLSRSSRRRYSLSWVMMPFASEAHKLWQEHLTSFLSCQNQFLDG